MDRWSSARIRLHAFYFFEWCDDAATDTALAFSVLFCLCRAVPLPCLRRPSLGAIDQRRVAPVPRVDNTSSRPVTRMKRHRLHVNTNAQHGDPTLKAQTKHSLRSALTDAVYTLTGPWSRGWPNDLQMFCSAHLNFDAPNFVFCHMISDFLFYSYYVLILYHMITRSDVTTITLTSPVLELKILFFVVVYQLKYVIIII